MTVFQQELVACIKEFPGSTDRELTDKLFGRHVHPSRVNQEARLLDLRGKLERRKREDGRIGNFPIGSKEVGRVRRIVNRGLKVIFPPKARHR
jgi:hypothetical protein